MINQVLFGETMLILKEKKKWSRVITLFDNYEGWVTNNQLESIGESLAKTFNPWVTTDLLNIIELTNQNMHIPIGSSLLGFDGEKGKFGKIEYQFSGNKIKRNEMTPNSDLLEKFSKQWLNAPYLWGGRTLMGVDCSGFAQTVFKLLGIDLPRDAWQQAQRGKPVNKLKEAASGDLAFFNDKEEIVHVGILLNQGQIIHASGKVRIDEINKIGIINSDTGQRTHLLKAIRRNW